MIKLSLQEKPDQNSSLKKKKNWALGLGIGLFKDPLRMIQKKKKNQIAIMRLIYF